MIVSTSKSRVDYCVVSRRVIKDEEADSSSTGKSIREALSDYGHEPPHLCPLPHAAWGRGNKPNGRRPQGRHAGKRRACQPLAECHFPIGELNRETANGANGLPRERRALPGRGLTKDQRARLA